MNVCTATLFFSLKVRDKHHDDNLMKLGVSYLSIRKFIYYLYQNDKRKYIIQYLRLFQQYLSSLSATEFYQQSLKNVSTASQLLLNSISELPPSNLWAASKQPPSSLRAASEQPSLKNLFIVCKKSLCLASKHFFSTRCSGQPKYSAGHLPML